MSNADLLRVRADDLTAFAARILAAGGTTADEGRQVAERLVMANLTGHDSHGVSRVPRYVQAIADGLVVPGRDVKVVRDGPAGLVLDADSGFGQTTGAEAVRRGCDRAAETGSAIVTLRNAGHLGRIGDWAEDAAARGFVSIHMVSVRGRSLVAPFGGIDRRLATSPFCAGAPLAGGEPLVLDFATSKIAEGKALVAAVSGTAVPEGAFVSADGLPSTDPGDLYGDTLHETVPDASAGHGALAAFGDHKGSGLSFMIEVLAGALSGGGVNRTLTETEDAPFRNAMLSIYIDPEHFAGRAAFDAQVKAWIAYLKSARVAPGHDDVLAPGEKERRTRAERLAGGVPLTRGVWDRLVSTAQGLGVADIPSPD